MLAGPDLRKQRLPRGLPHERPQRHIVDHFFTTLYVGAAEDLPEIATMHGVDAAIEGNVDCSPESELGLGWQPDAPVPELLVALSQGTARTRHLPPGKPIDVWWQFLAWFSANRRVARVDETDLEVEDHVVPSWTTFWRAWSEHWRLCLKFRKQSSHAECNLCHDFRAAVHSPQASPADKLQAAAQWRAHLRDQYHDRLLYWTLRYASRTRKMGVLTLIIDAMDKSKFAYPKWPWHRESHELERFNRPPMSVTAALVHGWHISVFVAEDTVPHGADCFLEILCQCLERVYAEAVATARAMPSHLVVQCDNTPAQAKNDLTHKFLSSLVARRKFASCTMNYLPEGHTHEDVDQFFSCLLPLLRRVQWESIDNLVEHLQIGLPGLAAARGPFGGGVQCLRSIDLTFDSFFEHQLAFAFPIAHCTNQNLKNYLSFHLLHLHTFYL